MDRRKALIKRWSDDETFHKWAEERDISTDPNAKELVGQIRHLHKIAPTYREFGVEVGGGDGKLLDHLNSRPLFDRLIGSDIPGHRLDRARQDFPNLQIEAADAVAMAERYAAPNVTFVAFNVLGNLVESDLRTFLGIIAERGSALVFCAGVLPLDSDIMCHDRGLAFSYNFPALARESGLGFTACLYRQREDGSLRYGMIATLVPKDLLDSIRESLAARPNS